MFSRNILQACFKQLKHWFTQETFSTSWTFLEYYHKFAQAGTLLNYEMRLRIVGYRARPKLKIMLRLKAIWGRGDGLVDRAADLGP